MSVTSRTILGVRVDDVDYDQTIALCRAFVLSGWPHQLVTVNPEFVVAAQHDRVFRGILRRASLAVPDGSGLIWASRILGRPLRATVRGVDLVDRLAAAAAANGWRIFLLGAGPGVAESTARRLTDRYPGLQIAGTFAGRSGPDGETETIAAVRAAQPVDVLFVAFGHPAQDYWIARNAAALGIPLALGVGGAFDYIAGVVRRAPAWVTNAGFEWLYRLVNQPWRWRRQLALLEFIQRVVLARLGRGVRSSGR